MCIKTIYIYIYIILQECLWHRLLDCKSPTACFVAHRGSELSWILYVYTYIYIYIYYIYIYIYIYIYTYICNTHVTCLCVYIYIYTYMYIIWMVGQPSSYHHCRQRSGSCRTSESSDAVLPVVVTSIMIPDVDVVFLSTCAREMHRIRVLMSWSMIAWHVCPA